ncbi:hypothetical protein Tco_1560104 [Tanacetum coccineum]
MKNEGLKRQRRNSSNDDKISEDLLKEGNKINIDDLLKRIKTTSVKAVEESCVTCGGPHPYYQCLATDGKASGYKDNIQAYVSAAAVNYNQGNAGHRPPSVAHQVRPPSFSPVQNN